MTRGRCLYTNGQDVELGYTLGREHWARGYGREAAQRCVDAARELGLHELIALVRPQNTGSMAILHGLGFVREEAVTAYGQPYDRYRMDVPPRGGDSVSPARPPGSAEL